MIEIQNLTKKFGEKTVINNLSLTIPDKGFAVIMGKSGCGKTTLLNIIGSLEPFDSGSVIVDGIDVSDRKNQLEFLRTKVSFLFQNFALVDNKTVSENLEMIRANTRTDISLEKALEMVGMSGTEEEKVYKLSGGEQQRIALARLLMKKSDVILADEPTGSLDKENAEAVLNILKTLNEMGKTIVLVTHDKEIEKYSNQSVTL